MVATMFVDDEALTWQDLPPRQQEVLLGDARGRTNRQIAEDLDIAIRTVQNVVALVYDRLGISNRVMATRWVLAHEDIAAAILADV